jgi:Flp pilus assembly protein TadG
MTFLRLSRAFARDRRGVSAVEFAMLLPLMVTLYLGTVEVSQGVSIDRKITLTARTVGDLVTQYSNINNATMTNILNASAKIVGPYPDGPLKVTVSAVTIAADMTAKIAWTDTLKGTNPHQPGDPVTDLPEALKVPNTQLIWAETEYQYTPTIGYVVTGPLTLSEKIYMRPRLSDTITRSAN